MGQESCGIQFWQADELRYCKCLCMYVHENYLEEGGMALELGGAEGSHWTQAGPEVDTGE